MCEHCNIDKPHLKTMTLSGLPLRFFVVRRDSIITFKHANQDHKMVLDLDIRMAAAGPAPEKQGLVA
jgi:hypothetical protein